MTKNDETQKPKSVDYNPKAAKWSILYRVRKTAWDIVNCTLFRFSPFFCYGWRRFLLRLFGASISRTASIGRTAIINVPWNLTMDDNSMICKNAWVMCSGKVSIGRNSMIGEYSKVLAGSHNSNSLTYSFVTPPIVIEDDCWIASGAMLVAGGKRPLKIGRGAIVGAGAVVFANVKSMTIVVGNPAEYLTDRVLSDE